jgi:GNAT superfamily N-acetyltransferase
MTMLVSDPDEEGVYSLLDEAGIKVGWTALDRRTEPHRAEPLVRAPGVSADRLATAVAADLPGVRVATGDEALAERLVLRGANPVRHATVMVAARPGTAAAASTRISQYDISPMDSAVRRPGRLAAQLAQLRSAAYPAGHPDHDPTDSIPIITQRLRTLLSGEILGAVDWELSALASGRGGDLVGAIIVTGTEADAIWPGGPWIADLFVDPKHRGQGLGRGLLHHALTADSADPQPRIGLAVTATNRATVLYRSMGFADLFTAWTIDVPASAARHES